MAGVTGGWTTYGVGWPKSVDANATASAVGNKEQFLGDIAIIDPRDTPTFDLLGKEQWSAAYQEWPIDTLAATATAASEEAWEFAPTALTGRTRYSNVTQAFHRGIIVSRRQQQMSQRGVTQGVGDEFRYQIGKKLLELNRDINSRIVASGTAILSATGATGTGSTMAALRAFQGIVTNVSGAFATASYAALHRKMDEVGSDPDTLLVSSGVKADISNQLMGFPGGALYGGASAVRRITMSADDRKVGAIVEILEDDFGRVAIYRDRWIPTAASTVTATATAVTATAGLAQAAAGCFFLLDRKMVKIGIFQAPMLKPLPPNGDYERGFVVAEVSLKVLHPSAIGFGANVTQTAV